MKQIAAETWYDPHLDQTVPPQMRILGNGFGPVPFLVIPDAVSPALCRQLFDEAMNREDAGLARVKDEGTPTARIATSLRLTTLHTLSPGGMKLYGDAVADLRPEIERFFNLMLLEGSGLQVLGYGPGGFYGCHADNCSMIVGPDGEVAGWKPVASYRKITTVLFLNGGGVEPFEGGELRFDFLFDAKHTPLVITPEAGAMIAFPSNPYFAHSVLPVVRGYRMTAVEWFDAMAL